MNNFNDRTTLAIKLAKDVGEILTEIYNRDDFEVKSKGKNDVVTEADFKSENYIINAIKDNYKDDSVISEELGKIEKKGEYVWIIDPLDGTVNFSKKVPMFAVSIAYMKDNIVLGGAVYLPMYDMLFVAEKGKGAYLNNKKMQITQSENLSDVLVCVDYANREWCNKELHFLTYEKLFESALNVIKLECAVLNSAFTACGKFGATYEESIFIWDIAATSLMTTEAGGIITDKYGKELVFDKTSNYSIIASNKTIHGQLLEIIEKVTDEYEINNK